MREKLLQKEFPAEEFNERRRKIFEAIGPEAQVLVKGAVLRGDVTGHRQNNEFYYLCGIEASHAYLLLDGSTRRTTLYLFERNERRERAEGPLIGAQDEDLLVRKTGVDRVADLNQIENDLNEEGDLFILQTPSEGSTTSQDTIREAYELADADPWDDKPAALDQFTEKICARRPNIRLHDLFPIIEEMRIVKSDREIAVMRRAGHLTALAVNEAIRSVRLGVMEYELAAAAEYVFRVNGAFGGAYAPIISAGENIWHCHYSRNDCALNAGELVLVDYAPDFRYYTSDIGRMIPVDGRYTETQRMFYGWVVEYHKVLLEKIRPGVSAEQVESEAAGAMEPRLDSIRFEDPEVEAGFRKTLETRHLTHGVGMAVHDPGNYRKELLRPGVVIALDPQFWVPEQEIYYRVEDTVVVTEDGIENFTEASPLELDALEQMMHEEGLLQLRPPAPASL